VILSPSPGQLLGAALAPAGLVAFAGTAEPGATVAVTVGAASTTALASAGGGFTAWLLLVDGDHQAVLHATDAAGNDSAPATVAFSTDSLPPALQLAWPGPGALLGGADAPLGKVGFAGTSESGAGLVLAVDGASVPVVRAGTAFSAVVTLADGQHLATVTATDAAGNQALLTVPFDLDVTPPPAPLILSPAPGASLPAGATRIAGTAEPGARVRVTLGPLTATVTAGAGGAFETSFTLAVGPQSVAAIATDAAGNGSPETQLAFVVVTAPQEPGGCGCSHGPGAGSGPSLLLLALAAFWPKRRRTRARRGS
jgi:MYXO-CTERM domain-containing protein